MWCMRGKRLGPLVWVAKGWTGRPTSGSSVWFFCSQCRLLAGRLLQPVPERGSLEEDPVSLCSSPPGRSGSLLLARELPGAAASRAAAAGNPPSSLEAWVAACSEWTLSLKAVPPAAPHPRSGLRAPAPSLAWAPDSGRSDGLKGCHAAVFSCHTSGGNFPQEGDYVTSDRTPRTCPPVPVTDFPAQKASLRGPGCVQTARAASLWAGHGLSEGRVGVGSPGTRGPSPAPASLVCEPLHLRSRLLAGEVSWAHGWQGSGPRPKAPTPGGQPTDGAAGEAEDRAGENELGLSGARTPPPTE